MTQPARRAAASEEVAASTSEIAARSRTSADTAERARAGIVECAGDMRQASERMSLIEARTDMPGELRVGQPVDVHFREALVGEASTEGPKK